MITVLLTIILILLVVNLSWSLLYLNFIPHINWMDYKENPKNVFYWITFWPIKTVDVFTIGIFYKPFHRLFEKFGIIELKLDGEEE